MRVFIVYCHPSPQSFTHRVLDAFTSSLTEAGHEYEVSDLYAMNFNPDLGAAEYLREAHYRDDLPVPEDVLAEQEKIRLCQALVFIYPLFWTDVPAKLKGWFDRVWTYGFAYGPRSMPKLELALALCSAGNSLASWRNSAILRPWKPSCLGIAFSTGPSAKNW